MPADDVEPPNLSDVEDSRATVDDWPVATSRPRARPDLSTVQLDDNVAIYDEVGQVLVLLNTTAAAVLERCDGNTSFQAIVDELADYYDMEREVLREDAWNTLRKFASMQLVTDE
jgi:hypothetical protein